MRQAICRNSKPGAGKGAPKDGRKSEKSYQQKGWRNFIFRDKRLYYQCGGNRQNNKSVSAVAEDYAEEYKYKE